MPEVMEPEGVEFGHGACPREGCPDPPPAAPVPSPESDALLRLTGERREDGIDGAVHRHIAPAAALRFLDPDDGAREVDPLPGQPEDLATAHSCMERDGHDRMKKRVLRGTAGLEEAHGFVLAEKAQPALWFLAHADPRRLGQITPLLSETQKVP